MTSNNLLKTLQYSKVIKRTILTKEEKILQIKISINRNEEVPSKGCVIGRQIVPLSNKTGFVKSFVLSKFEYKRAATEFYHMCIVNHCQNILFFCNLKI